MKKLFLFFLLLGFGALGFFYEEKSFLKLASLKQRNEVFPIKEKKTFAIVIYAHNDAFWCKRALRSLFEQDLETYRLFFVDDASEDGTWDMVNEFIIESCQEHRTILVRHEKKIGYTGALYRAVDHLSDQEIVIPLSAKDWFLSPAVLTDLNLTYQNPAIWLTVSPVLSYPSYEKINHKTINTPCSFYAGLFKQIKLIDALENRAWGTSLLKMSQGHLVNLSEPLFFQNNSLSRGQPLALSKETYTPLTAFSLKTPVGEKADLVLFSFDRPLQLFACLESIERYMSGVETVTVICRTSNHRFKTGYREVAAQFPKTRFLFQSMKEPKKDFKSLVLKSVFQQKSPFVLFGVDDLIVKDFVDLTSCTRELQKTGAYGFYLRFGQNINFCYQTNAPQKVPDCFSLGGKLLAWDLKKAEADWGFPNNMDMTIYRKSDLKKPLKAIRFTTPNSLESNWAAEFSPKEAIGLCFTHSKVVNIPLNVLGKTGNPHMNFASTEALLERFEAGERIDLDPFFQIENTSPHYPMAPTFINRNNLKNRRSLTL